MELEPTMTCPTGATMNENKLCVMTPLFTCPANYALNSEIKKCVPVTTTATAPAQAQEQPQAQAPVQPQSQPQAQMDTISPMCPTGYEYRDSMCYPLKI